MPTFIVKASRDADLYIGWSSVVEAPVWYGTRADALSQEGVTEERLARTDQTGTSALWAAAGYPQVGAWDDAEGFIYMQMGWLRRERFGDLIAAYEANPNDPDVSSLLSPFDDEDDQP